MDLLSVGFWGAFFGTVALMLAAALMAFLRSLHRVALTAALSSVVSALFVVAFLGWLPIDDSQAQARVLAHVAVITSVSLGLMLLAMLGLLRRGRAGRRARNALVGVGVGVAGVGWLLAPMDALALRSGLALAGGTTSLGDWWSEPWRFQP